MEPADVADQIQETAEEHRVADERFRRRAAVFVGVLAMLLAIAHLGANSTTKETINANIQASDTYAFYQAKTIRQTDNQLAADALEVTLLSQAGLPGDAVGSIQERLDRYKATVARYESEPDPHDPTNPLKGEGKKELLARAQDWEAKRDHAQLQLPNFEYAEALFQIGIVIGSVSIVAASRQLLGLGIGLGAAATLLAINGFFLFVELPFLAAHH